MLVTASPTKYTTTDTNVVCARIPWRRRDDPASVGVFVMNEDASEFLPSAVHNSNSTVGEVCFQTPLEKTSQFAIYYLPYAWSFDAGSGSFHSHFLDAHSTTPLLPSVSSPIVTAEFVRFESYSDFDLRSEMEFVATEQEVRDMLAKSIGKITSRL